jgi:hypothetical protein
VGLSLKSKTEDNSGAKVINMDHNMYLVLVISLISLTSVLLVLSILFLRQIYSISKSLKEDIEMRERITRNVLINLHEIQQDISKIFAELKKQGIYLNKDSGKK